jgi:hypothetical protein
MKIISKEEITQLDNSKYVSDKIENNELNKLTKPPQKKKLIRAPRLNRPAPEKINIETLKTMMKPPPPRYTEYRASLSNCIDTALCLIETNEDKKSGLIDKIKSSRDIQSMVKDRVLDTLKPVEDNSFLALVTTLSSFYIENKLTM